MKPKESIHNILHPSAPLAAPAQGETRFRGAFPVRAGHRKPDEIVVLKSQFDGVADKLDAAVRELNEAKTLYAAALDTLKDMSAQVAQLTGAQDRMDAEIAMLTADLFHATSERDQARQDLEERCAENDRERAAHLQAYQAVTRERDEARGEALGRKTQLTYAQGLLTAAESELAELRLDRERIEWLDKNVTVAAKYRCQRPCSDHDGPTYWSFNWSQWHNNEENSLTIRAAIDAARQSSSTHQHSANQTKHE